jgi:hypothetical protein
LRAKAEGYGQKISIFFAKPLDKYRKVCYNKDVPKGTNKKFRVATYRKKGA